MARNTQEYTGRYDLDEPYEGNEWKKESNVAQLFAAEMEEKHPALFQELQDAAAGDLDHRKMSWIKDEYNLIRYTSEDESTWTRILNPEGDAEKIFTTFGNAMWHEEGTKETAEQIVLAITHPMEKVVGRLQEAKEDYNDPIAGMAQAIPTIFERTKRKAIEALCAQDEEAFAGALERFQALSTDTHFISRDPDHNLRVMDFIEKASPEHARELRAAQGPDFDPNSASWLRSSEEGGSAMELYESIQEAKINMGHVYRDAVAETAIQSLSNPVAFQLEEFKSSHEDSPAMNAVEEYLDSRLYNLQEMAKVGLRQSHAETYQHAMENLGRLQEEVRTATGGEVPGGEKWDDGSRWNDQTTKLLEKAREEAR